MQENQQGSTTAAGLVKADVVLTVVFGAATLVLYIAGGSFSFLSEYSAWHLAAFAAYVCAKVVAANICSYGRFAAFVSAQDRLSLFPGLPLSGFSIFKTILVLSVVLGFLFFSWFFLLAEAFLVVAMRWWARNYDVHTRNN